MAVHYHHHYELYIVVSVNLKFQGDAFKRYVFHYRAIALTCYGVLVLFLSGIPIKIPVVFFFFFCHADRCANMSERSVLYFTLSLQVLSAFVYLICANETNDEVKIEVLFVPENCTQKSRKGDLLHAHYDGYLAKDGSQFYCR